MTSKVSVIVPCYHTTPTHLSQCCGSLAVQTFQKWEALFIVDGVFPCDPIISFLDSRLDSRIKIIPTARKTNPASARNRGIQRSTGGYIAFLDSDDWFVPDKLTRQANYLDSHPDMDWCWHKMMYVPVSGGINLVDYPFGGNDKERYGACHSIMVRRSCIDKIEKEYGNIFNESMDRLDDSDFVLRLNKYPSGCVPEYLAYFRETPGGLSDSTSHIRSQRILLNTFIRNGSWSLVPGMAKELSISVINELTGIDWVKWKKEVFG